MDQIFAVFISSGSPSLRVTVVSSATDERAKGALFTGTRSEFEAYAERVIGVPPKAKPAITECFEQCAGEAEGFTIKKFFTLAAETPVSPTAPVVCTHAPRVNHGYCPRAQGNGSL